MTIFRQEKSFHIHSEAHIQLPSLFKKLKDRSPFDRKTGFRQEFSRPKNKKPRKNAVFGHMIALNY